MCLGWPAFLRHGKLVLGSIATVDVVVKLSLDVDQERGSADSEQISLANTLNSVIL